MPDRCYQHLPRPHIPCPWSWEALCCLLTVERCPPPGQRLREATCLSSAFMPGPDADRRTFFFPRPGFLAADWRRRAPRARYDGWTAVVVGGDRLGRGRGPRRRRRAPPAVP